MAGPDDPRVHSIIGGKWRVDALLGTGSMASVYAVTHRNGSRAALKILHEQLASDVSVCERFLGEGYLTNAIKHRGIVRVFDDGMTDDGAPFLAMDLLEGETLEVRRTKAGGKLAVFDVIEIADKVMDTLAAVHNAGIIHRDLKPQNVFCEHDGGVRLLDFGVARLQERVTGHSMVGMVLGTPSFMSPEQALGGKDVDSKSDIWALGAIMFTLLTGETVHVAATVQARLLAAASVRARSVASVARSLHPDVVLVVDTALQFKKEDRWQTVTAMRNALANVKQSLPPPGVAGAMQGYAAPQAAPPPQAAASRAAPPQFSAGPQVPGQVTAAMPASPQSPAPRPGSNVPSARAAGALPTPGAGMGVSGGGPLGPPPPARARIPSYLPPDIQGSTGPLPKGVPVPPPVIPNAIPEPPPSKTLVGMNSPSGTFTSAAPLPPSKVAPPPQERRLQTVMGVGPSPQEIMGATEAAPNTQRGLGVNPSTGPGTGPQFRPQSAPPPRPPQSSQPGLPPPQGAYPSQTPASQTPAPPGAIPTPGVMQPQGNPHRAPYESLMPAGESGGAPAYGNTYQPWAQGGAVDEDPFAQSKRRRMMIGISVAAMVAAALLAFGAVAFIKDGTGRTKPSPSANGAQSADGPGANGPNGPLSYAPTGLRFDGGVYVFSNPAKPTAGAPPTAVTAPSQVIDPNFVWPPQNAAGKDAGGAGAAKDAGTNGPTGAGGTNGEADSGASIELW